MSRIAVVLFNLGGPDSLDAVRPFLKNLFSDPAIIGAPAPIRWMLARLISTRRAPVARKIYAQMGGRSPILPQTEAQASALKAALEAAAPQHDWDIAIAMRYWHPFADAAVRHVKSFRPDRIVLVPLYPQYSTTTTGSSFADWEDAAKSAGLSVPTSRLCCYPDHAGFIDAVTDLAADGLSRVFADASGAPVRLLFSAHGLPKRVIAGGDPYQSQVEMSVAAVRAALAHRGLLADVDLVTCYQSRVGPLEWIGPATDAEIRRAGAAGAAIVVVPIAFVSEHSETLVELDIEYRHLATAAGARAYVRVPAVATTRAFIAGLSQLVQRCAAGNGTMSGAKAGPQTRICPPACTGCNGPI